VASVYRLQERIAGMMLGGASIDRVEAEVIEPCGLDEDHKAELRLFAGSLDGDHRSRASVAALAHERRGKGLGSWPVGGARRVDRGLPRHASAALLARETVDELMGGLSPEPAGEHEARRLGAGYQRRSARARPRGPVTGARRRRTADWGGGRRGRALRSAADGPRRGRHRRLGALYRRRPSGALGGIGRCPGLVRDARERRGELSFHAADGRTATRSGRLGFAVPRRLTFYAAAPGRGNEADR
jgi:hypothetical protein